MIFYTSITNGYDKLSTPPKSDVKFICFYDGDKPDTDGWEYRKIEIDEECPVRKSYHPKHCPHLYFDADAITVWIDASYIITNDLIEYSKDIFEEYDFVLQRHPDKRSMIAEFEKLYYDGFSTRDEIYDMCKRIKEVKYPLKYYDQTINCVIWRRLTPDVIEWGKVWREWYDNGVNRDQISSSIAEFLVVKAHRVDLAIDMGQSSRVKSYGDSYKLHKPDGEIIDSIRKIFPIQKRSFNTNTFTNPDDMIVYTCITNGYDNLISDYYHPSVRYVCFHDGTIDTSITPWEYIKLDVDIDCPRRLSFFPKANPHLFFPDGSKTIWIDACYQQTSMFIRKSRTCFPFTILRHPSRFTYYDEILEGFMCAFFTFDDAVNLTQELKDSGYDFKSYSSPLGTILWRTMSPEMTKFNESWYKWSLIGCNRDQIALDKALKESDTLPAIIENREETGVPLGYQNKIGRKGRHPQRGDMKQYERKDELLQELKKITGLHPRLYTKHDHKFMMEEYGVL
tara:strand:+ start:1024 stop:2550 length:1527 start_codon:yes stop_codon:yes gene_type:complete